MKQANVRRIKKERIKRIHVKKHEKIIKFLMFSRITSKSKGNEQRIAKKCYKRKKKNGISNCRNHCLISGRAHSIYTKFRLARNEMKRFAHKGLLFGVTKASWLYHKKYYFNNKNEKRILYFYITIFRCSNI